MNNYRIIPVLSIIGQQLVKTLKFDKPKYVGDPINAIKIFNDKEVDELVILDIRASRDKKGPNLKLITEMAGESFMPLGYGAQSVVVSLDYQKKLLGSKKPVFNSASKSAKTGIVEWARMIEKYGAGEIILQCVDRDGTFEGYDEDTLKEVSEAVGIPVVAAGGARGPQDFKNAVEKCGASAVAAGSHFVFKNNNRDSILINYSNTIA